MTVEYANPLATTRARPRLRWLAPLFFAVVTFAVFGSTLVGPSSGDRVISGEGTDLTLQFLAWRDFGFTQMRAGHLPLWNPHIYGGAPYFAGFQSALLYPPNWLHLVLPLARAINWIVALHVFAAGYFTYLWCLRRTRCIPASLLGGVMFMFGGPYFLHVFAGHLPHVAVIVWIPLIFLAIDGLTDGAHPKWWLLGSLAVAMQILAGHPQYVYYTAIVAGIYAVLNAATKARRTRREDDEENAMSSPLWSLRDLRAFVATLSFVGAMYITGAMLSAIQLLPGIGLTSESIRSGGLSYAMAGTFSLPPENLLTMLAPTFFGGITLHATSAPMEGYFGRTYLWESSLFVGVTGLLLATYGALAGERRARRFAVTMVFVCLVLALGRYTPLYPLMYKLVPQYSSFRGTVKFATMGALFVSMLAAIGASRLADAPRATRSIVIGAGIVALGLVTTALFIRTSGPDSKWASMLNAISNARTSGESNELFVFQPQMYRDATFIASTARHASNAALVGALTLVVGGAIVFLARLRLTAARWTLLGLATIEMIVFATTSYATTNATLSIPPAWTNALSKIPADSRVLTVGDASVLHANTGMSLGFDNLWGYDPGVLKRYAELMTYSQGFDPDHARQYLIFRSIDRNIFRLARCRLILQLAETDAVIPMADALPTLTLIRNYSVMDDRDEIFAAISSAAFDPRSVVVLEKKPTIEPIKGNSIGEIRIVSETTDAMEIKADLETPAILLVTNNFSNGWRVRSLDAKPPQQNYAIQPANWSFQAIPLAAGAHHFTLEYRPFSFTIGAWVTGVSLLCLAIAWGRLIIGSKSSPKPLMPSPRTFR